jgi:hypothetical protein
MLPTVTENNKKHNNFSETTVTLGDKEHHVIVGNAGVSMNDIKTKIAKTHYLYSKNMASITTVVPKPNEIIKISNMSKIPLKGPPAPVPVPVPFHVNNPVYNKPNVPIPNVPIPNVPISMVLPKPTNRNNTRKKSLPDLSKYGLRPRAKKIITTPETRNYYEKPNYKQGAAEIAARAAARDAVAAKAATLAKTNTPT